MVSASSTASTFPDPSRGVTSHDRDGVRNLAPLVTSISYCLSGTTGHVFRGPARCDSISIESFTQAFASLPKVSCELNTLRRGFKRRFLLLIARRLRPMLDDI
jgi:hypothetical protein